VAGAADDILKTLEVFGLTWDGSVYYQSDHLDRYQTRLEFLEKKHCLYPCTCSRKTLAHADKSYPGYCKNKTFPQTLPYATRIRVTHASIDFYDALQGKMSENPASRQGDFIIRRKDRIFAYQFAVVIDDAEQQVNHIVRGADLLESTARQIYLQQQLGLSKPSYLHVPLLTDSHGDKLSKQTFAQAVNRNSPARVLFKLLQLLRQAPPLELAEYPVTQVLDWAIAHWQPAALKNIGSVYGDL